MEVMDSPTGSVKSVKLSALDRLRAKTKHIPKIDGPTAEEQRAEAAKKKKASFNFDWSWRAFVGEEVFLEPWSEATRRLTRVQRNYGQATSPLLTLTARTTCHLHHQSAWSSLCQRRCALRHT